MEDSESDHSFEFEDDIDDPRFDLISVYVLSSFHIKPDKWRKLMLTDNYRVSVKEHLGVVWLYKYYLQLIVGEWIYNPRKMLLIFTLNSSYTIIPRHSFYDTNANTAVALASAAVSNFLVVDNMPKGKAIYFLKSFPVEIQNDNFPMNVIYGDVPATNHIKTLAVLFEDIYIPLLSNKSNRELWPPTAAMDIEKQIKQMQLFLEEVSFYYLYNYR